MNDVATTAEKIVKPIFRQQPQEIIPKATTVGESGELFKTPAETKEIKPEDNGEKLRHGFLVYEEGGKEPVETIAPEDYYLTSPLFHKVTDYFGLKRTEWEFAKNQLSVIVDWAILESGSNKPYDILRTISELEKRLKSPGFQEKRHAIVYRHIRLLGQRREIDRELSLYEQEGGERH